MGLERDKIFFQIHLFISRINADHSRKSVIENSRAAHFQIALVRLWTGDRKVKNMHDDVYRLRSICHEQITDELLESKSKLSNGHRKAVTVSALRRP